MTDIEIRTNTPNIKEVIAFISNLIKSRKPDDSIEQDSKVAYQIVTIYSLENSDDLCKDKELDNLISIAGGLEIPNGTMAQREEDWVKINHLLHTLQTRYL